MIAGSTRRAATTAAESRRETMRYLPLVAYIATIFAANWAIVTLGLYIATRTRHQ